MTYFETDEKRATFLRFDKVKECFGRSLKEALTEKYAPDEKLTEEEKKIQLKEEQDQLYAGTMTQGGKKKIEILGMD